MAADILVSSESNNQKLFADIEKLPIAKEIQVDLTECLKGFSDLDLHHTYSSLVETSSKFSEVIILLNKFAQATLDALKACELLPFPSGIICKAITTVVGIIFNRNVAFAVINKFTDFLEKDLVAKCRAACTKIAHNISYLQGLPAADQLTPEQKSLHLQLVATDVPILIGLDEVLFLGDKIRDMVKTADIKKKNKLFEHLQVYCCLATFRELLLLYRCSIQSTFSVDNSSVRNMLDAQKSNDKEVLEFMYKPTMKTACLFRCYSPGEWPILEKFLQRRGLFPEDASDLNGKKLQIRSVKKSGEMIQPYMMLSSKDKTLVLTTSLNDAATHLELRGGKNNEFTIWSHCFDSPRQMYFDKNSNISISHDEPLIALSRWYLLKLQPESPEEKTCYMIWLASDKSKCTFAKTNATVSIANPRNPRDKYFWQMELLN